MDKRYNLSNYQAKFTDYLVAENISPLTLKYYRSDIKHFFSWLAKTNASNDIAEMVTFENIVEYKNYSAQDEAPVKTINRRLSTIRKFCTFCISQGWLSENPAKKVINVTKTMTTAKLSVEEPQKNDLFLEFKQEFPTDYANLSDFFEIINYSQLESKTN